MSLILEALKKLDRDKQAPERGFLVVGTATWPAGGARGRRVVLAAGVLVLVVAGAATFLRRAPSAPPSPPTPAPGVAPPDSAPAVAHPSPAPAPARLLAAPVDVRRPAPRPTPTPSRTFTLTAISQQDGHPVAVLNDRLVREGDMFDGVRILRIGAAEVEIEVDGRKQVVAF